VIPEQTFAAFFATILEERNADAAMDFWADDDDVTMWGSDLPERAVGRDAIRELLARVTGSRNQLGFRWDERRFHTIDDVAWLNAAGTLTLNGTAPMPYRLTMVFVFAEGTWKIHTFNGSVPD
jgi:ketosteroid isomerase-like protein